MRPPLSLIAIAAAVALAPLAQANNVAGLDVTVKKNGKAVHQTKTDARGSFATSNLEPGAYNVEFRSPKGMDLKNRQLAISVSTGKGAPRQANAEGAHLRSGVALAVEVPKVAKLTGQVRSTGAVASARSEAVPAGMERVRANIKVINGKRHVWVPAPIGSNMGGRWVEEGTEGAVLSTSNKKGGDGEVLRHIQDQAGNVGQR